MLQISFRPISPVFTSELPTQITITTDSDAAIDISVEIEGANGFSTTLYPYNGKAVFHDLRSIVEQTMLADTRPYLSVILFAEQGTDTANTPECVCIYSRLAVSQNGLAFTSQHFLTTAQSYLLPRTATQRLSYFSPNAYEADEYESETAMLTPYEARRLSRLLLSSTIKAALTDFNESRPSSIPNSLSPIPIIITDLTSDISDAHNATNTVKFKWKYRTPQFPHTVSYPSNIFDDPFSRPFD